ncbi:hypothetical protein EXIGLDRAFT_734475, partial [Exidia glandulosa HHB12029]
MSTNVAPSSSATSSTQFADAWLWRSMQYAPIHAAPGAATSASEPSSTAMRTKDGRTVSVPQVRL